MTKIMYLIGYLTENPNKDSSVTKEFNHFTIFSEDKVYFAESVSF